MVRPFDSYRMACIFALADQGFEVMQIKGMEERIAEGFADRLTVEEVVDKATLSKVAV